MSTSLKHVMKELDPAQETFLDFPRLLWWEGCSISVPHISGNIIIPCKRYIIGAIFNMSFEIEYTDDFERWWNKLDSDEQISVEAYVGLLESRGPPLPYPYSSAIRGSKCGRLRELRIQHRGKPYRVLYAFDPRRTGILLIGGAKGGKKRWYQTQIPVAERPYDQHLKQLKKEGLI